MAARDKIAADAAGNTKEAPKDQVRPHAHVAGHATSHSSASNQPIDSAVYCSSTRAVGMAQQAVKEEDADAEEKPAKRGKVEEGAVAEDKPAPAADPAENTAMVDVNSKVRGVDAGCFPLGHLVHGCTLSILFPA